MSLLVNAIVIKPSPDAIMNMKAGLIAAVKIRPVDTKLSPRKNKLR